MHLIAEFQNISKPKRAKRSNRDIYKDSTD